ncbi:SWF or SNF family helicase [Streptomyces griseiscabiei]|uniref:SWF or SNF family helicase n=1 Tax=Streptomyces griseiscabiei TaxID=2993540 RepID=A0ABU4L583_9ACTN|nr:SWF or SNF family helicase [Streptomyces griseiscabiei]MBZ3901970.1 SWF or SNF family helicase [Streptomyces griseiscabiei]MDX2910829.1 SWF or SNF family helicase [Streptomyces griseiscabiei]
MTGRTGHDEERTFAASAPAHGRGFARTWWGRAWLKALEDAALDGQQVKAGRRLARAGAVGAVSVRPGRVTAVVQDRDGTAHRADVLLQELSADHWDRFLDMTVERAGHIAALLDREMPTHLVEDAATHGVELLPGLGDLEARCDCGAWDHCGHTAALCYQVARLLDEDPFVLLLMRGRAERALLDELQVRSVAPAAEAAPACLQDGRQGGLEAAEAFAAGGILPPLPEPPPPPVEPGLPASLDTEVPPAPGVDPSALEFLAAQTAREARRMLADALRPGHERQPLEQEPTLDQDAVRLASGDPEPGVGARLARGSERGREGLALAVRAWRYGGPAALAVLDEEWHVQAESLARARAALETAWDDGERPALRAAHNRWTVVGGSAQLRLGRDGRWWPYRKERGRWAPAGPAAHDPATALASVDAEPGV